MSRRKPNNPTEIESQPSAMWRSLEDQDLELGASERADGSYDVSASSLVGRRGFLQVTGTAAAALTLEGCIRRPVENIMPFAEQPEYLVPGVPLHFATTTARGNDSLGLLVTSHNGRPTKIEGNPNHPSSAGATDVRAQLLVGDLYDPDRSKVPAKRGDDGLVDVTQEQFDTAFAELIATHEADGGAGLRFLAPPTNSPSFLRLRGAVKARFPQAAFHTYASINESSAREGARIAFGEPLAVVTDFAEAKVVLALDSDFLYGEDGSVRNARGFAKNRGVESPAQEMSRLYVVEATHSTTGANADHRLRVPAADVERYLRALARKLSAEGVSLGAIAASLGDVSADGIPSEWIDEVASELLANRGRAPIVVGPRQPARVHALAHALNAGLGNLGRTVALHTVSDPEEGDQVASIKALVDGIGQVRTLIILGGNPVYDSPADVDFAGALAKEGLTSVHLASHRNETSKLCSWHCPEANELEAWGDHRAVDGTLSVQQPLIAPLWHARSAIELLAMAASERNWRGYNVVRRTLRGTQPASAFEAAWRATLHSGVVVGSTQAPTTAPVQEAAIAQALAGWTPSTVDAEHLEVVFLSDSALYDGRHANNLWALEAPNAMTRLVWDNAALMSKATRDGLGLRNGQMVKLKREGAGEITVPVFALPGHADNSISLHLGWGRTDAGRYGSRPHAAYLDAGGGERPGFDVGPLRTSGAFHFTDGVTLTPTQGSYALVQMQQHDSMEHRDIALSYTKAEYDAKPDQASYDVVQWKSTPPLWPLIDYSHEHKWGLTIDLSACTGCNSCIVACQAENNIPVVGKHEVERGRVMAWLRIDRYFIGNDDEAEVSLQPVGCQQCEEAPCENVCPVNATTHSPEGLNDMAYNRCVGTRYCANNCPYKVRRFNYYDFHSFMDDRYAMYGAFPVERKMQFNPNVTVRMRGVMEKCTYCVQRIQSAKIAARREHRAIADGDIVTACQQVCPSDAIVFGDLNDPESRVAKLAARDRTYKLLADLGTRPRTTFLAKIRNLNPAMGQAEEGGADAAEAHG